jgi:Ca2+-binding EF-hand superfamily protein
LQTIRTDPQQWIQKNEEIYQLICQDNDGKVDVEDIANYLILGDKQFHSMLTGMLKEYRTCLSCNEKKTSPPKLSFIRE